MRNGSMLTTVDNPYNPFTHYAEWYAWDRSAGYDTPGLLARVAVSSDELSETDQSIALEDAITQIISENTLGLYRRLENTANIS